MRGVTAKFLFRSFIRGHLVNIITRVDVWYPAITEKNDVL